VFSFLKKPPVMTGGVLLDSNGAVVARARFDKPTTSVWRGLAELQSAARHGEQKGPQVSGADLASGDDALDPPTIERRRGQSGK
jgi:hypothetical protein